MTLKSWNLTPHVPDPPEKPVVSEVNVRRCVMSWEAPPGYNEEITAYFIQYVDDWRARQGQPHKAFFKPPFVANSLSSNKQTGTESVTEVISDPR